MGPEGRVRIMKAIEYRYQDVAKYIVAGTISTLDAGMNAAVTELYSIWTLQHGPYLLSLPNIRLNLGC
jgi:hypothetical protein